jgi:uncharacterized RDD family membrane protein YckC
LDRREHEERLEDGLPALSASMEKHLRAPRERAGFVSRLSAYFVDALILAVTIRGTAWLFDGAERMLGRFAPPVDLSALVIILAPLIVAVYLVAFWTTFGRTPGKWLLGLEVVPLEGGPLTFKRSLMRLVGYVVGSLPLYLGFLWILGPQRRGWHDRLARTEVDYVRRPAPEATAADELRRRVRGFRPERSVAFRRAGPVRASRLVSRP